MRQNKYSIRKGTMGVSSVVISTIILAFSGSIASANEDFDNKNRQNNNLNIKSATQNKQPFIKDNGNKQHLNAQYAAIHNHTKSLKQQNETTTNDTTMHLNNSVNKENIQNTSLEQNKNSKSNKDNAFSSEVLTTVDKQTLTTNNKDANESVPKIENNQQTDNTAKEDKGNEERQSTRTTPTTQDNIALANRLKANEYITDHNPEFTHVNKRAYPHRYRRIQDIKAQQYKNNQHKAQQFISNQTSSELSNNQNRTKYATESYHYMQPRTQQNDCNDNYEQHHSSSQLEDSSMKINAHATNTNHNSHDEQANIQREISNRRNEQSLMNNTAPIVEQSNNVAKQTRYKNTDPIILVHGFNGFTGDNNPDSNDLYWGGKRLDIHQDLTNNGYENYVASISAFGSNYDRAVELYYYIKGGTVDYGAVHAAKYGHARYGKTYEGVYKDWQPGQKIHLVGHSMGGQTVRQLESLLRNGSQEEIDYQRQHGGEIAPLYQGDHDNMITSITTVASPHNGTYAADFLGNEALIRQFVYDYSKFQGNKYSDIDFGLSQWGLKQRENETYIDYVERVKNESKIWQTDDNGFYDLTRAGATKLNQQTSLNPNIIYKSYSGESTRPTFDGKQKADINMTLRHTVPGNVIGKVEDKAWRENDGLVSVISAQYPFGERSMLATDEVKRGIWQVMPVKHDWDHGDFVGTDATETQISTDEIRQLWMGIANDLVKNETVVS
ncbi:YSIRK-targeted triacylglycerol lipase [Staphylococcus gallinarum]|uniref:YSIRK-targeted triacylglycerol lipase n=1 Tax=Staphylococcus gallinarum TaxID=1293 RepID=UPI000E67925B|nr:YSIRK-type signal peptide-containing protein [Staphylococcus gallinarum]MBU7218329.1 YSIRK-type signal peptide-containing protein [Staphylococcus gallinarum]RIO84491.1 YSIRK-type signal peptide-containing protein [Staphylococcus gallinarum]